MRRLVTMPPGSFLGSMPPVIRALIVVSVVLWIAALATRFEPASFWRPLILSNEHVLRRGWIWTLVTYQFLHDAGGIAHVLFNMLMLWMFGRKLEVRWGGWAFLRFYLACGIGAGLFHVLVSEFVLRQHAVPVIGASGSVLGIMIAWAMIWPDDQVLFMFMLPMRARHLVVVTALIELLFLWNRSHGVANLAHLGGMATGWAVLRHGWRLRRSLTRLLDLGSRSRVAWRRRHVKVVDREWEDWLRRNDPDEDDRETRH